MKSRIISNSLQAVKSAMQKAETQGPLSFVMPQSITKIIESHDIGSISKQPTSQEAILADWSIYLETGNLGALRSKLKHLAWVPHIALSSEYEKQFDLGNISLSKRVIKGLIFSVLQTPSAERKRKFAQYEKRAESGNISVQSYLKGLSKLISDDLEISQYCDYVIETQADTKVLLAERFRFDVSDTVFYKDAKLLIIRKSIALLKHQDKKIRDWLYQKILLPCDSFELTEFLKLLANKPELISDPRVKTEIKDFVTKHPLLGDPRLPGNVPSWNIHPKNVRDAIAVIFSEEDIRLFFELILSEREDEQKRKFFWLKYANKVLRTRLFLPKSIRTDQGHRLFARGNYESSVFGILLREPNLSAFVMDFGDVIAVEFSKAGNACFLYLSGDQNILHKDFWLKEIPVSNLKSERNSSRLRHISDKTDIKDDRRWHREFADILKTFGVFETKTSEQNKK